MRVTVFLTFGGGELSSLERARAGVVSALRLVSEEPNPTYASSLPPPGSPERVEGERNPATSASWGPLQVLMGVAALLLLLIMGGAVVSIFDPDFDKGGSAHVGASLAIQGFLAAALVAVAFATADEGRRLAAPRVLGLGASLRPPIPAAAMAYGFYVLCAIVLSVLINPNQDDITKDLGYGVSGLADVLTGFLIVVAAPITEEIFFRGFMFAGIRERAPFWVAALISAGVWGGFHYTGAGTGGVVLQLTVFGLILAWLYERTGSIRATVAVHMLNNAIAFFLLTN